MGHILAGGQILAHVRAVALLRHAGETVFIAVFSAVLEGKHAVPAGFVAGVIVDSNHRLVVAVYVGCIRHEIAIQGPGAAIWRRIQFQKRRPRGTYAADRDGVVRKYRACVVIAGAVGERPTRGLTDGGQWIVNLISDAALSGVIEVDAVGSGLQIGRDSARDSGERDCFPVAFKASKEENLVLLDRTANGAAELILVNHGFGITRDIVFKVVGVQMTVLEVIVGVAVELIAPGFHYHIDGSATGAPVACVVGGGHYVDFLQRVDVRRHRPRSLALRSTTLLYGHVGAVQSELLVILNSSAERVVIRNVPAARARISARAELGLRELRTRRGAEKGVDLTAVQRHVLQLARAQNCAAGTIGGFESGGAAVTSTVWVAEPIWS